MIPAGPLHPADLMVGSVAGLLVSGVLWRSAWWLPAATAAGLIGFGQRHGYGSIVDAVVDRPKPLLVLALIGGLGLTGRAIDSRLAPNRAFVPTLTVVTLAGVWAVVPDTEAPLMFAAALGLAPVASSRHESRPPGGSVLALAAVAAAIGSVGRPDRMGPAGVVIAAAVSLAVITATCLRLSGVGPAHRPESAPA